MDLGTVLDGLFPGGTSGALDALEACHGRVPRAVRAAAPKEWPPACPTGLCGTQGCVCRARSRACEDLTCVDIGIDLVAWAQLNEFGTMLSEPQKPFNVSPARTVAAPGKRGRGRPRKKPLKEVFAELPVTPPMMRPPPPRAPRRLVDDVSSMLHNDALNALSSSTLRDMEGLFRPAKARRGRADGVLARSLDSLYCLESLEGESYGELLCYETLPPY